MIKYTLYCQNTQNYHKGLKRFYFKTEDILNKITLEDYSTKYNILKDYDKDDYIYCRHLIIDLSDFYIVTYDEVQSLYKELSKDFNESEKIYGYNIRHNNILRDLQMIMANWDD